MKKIIFFLKKIYAKVYKKIYKVDCDAWDRLRRNYIQQYGDYLKTKQRKWELAFFNIYWGLGVVGYLLFIISAFLINKEDVSSEIIKWMFIGGIAAIALIILLEFIRKKIIGEVENKERQDKQKETWVNVVNSEIGNLTSEAKVYYFNNILYRRPEIFRKLVLGITLALYIYNIMFGLPGYEDIKEFKVVERCGLFSIILISSICIDTAVSIITKAISVDYVYNNFLKKYIAEQLATKSSSSIDNK